MQSWRALDTVQRLHRLASNVSGWRAGSLAGVLGALSALAMAPFYVFPILAVTLPACVWLIDGAAQRPRPVRAAAWRGWAFGFGYCLAGFYWIGFSFLVRPDAHLWLLPIAAILFPGGLALFFSAAFAGAVFVWRDGWQRVLVFSFMVSATEWLRGNIFTGLPWNLFGYTWGVADATIQFASVVGVYGLTLLTLIAAASPAAIVRHDGAPQAKPHLAWVALALPIFLFAFGWVRLPSGPLVAIDGLKLRVVQPNVPQSEKWVPELGLRNWQRLIEPLALNGQPAYTHAIWPEAAPPFFLREHAEALRMIGLSLPDGASLLTGAAYREERDGKTHYFNGMHVIDDQGRVTETYAKAHLVPFGEYLPFATFLEQLGVTKITGGSGGYTSGPGVRSVTVSLNGGRKTTFGPLICYEIVFPREVVEPGRRPDWLVNMTDDSWFGPSTGPYQHLGISRMRAAEEGLSVVRAANTGISAIIDPYGRVVASLMLNSQGVLDSTVPKPLSKTSYAAWGFVLYTVAMAALAVWIARGLRQRLSEAAGPTD